MQKTFFKVAGAGLLAIASTGALSLTEPILSSPIREESFSSSSLFLDLSSELSFGGQVLAAEETVEEIREELDLTPREIYQQAIDAVVTVVLVDENNEEMGFGSGFAIDSDGLILTNAHVVSAEHSAVFVVLADGTALEAEIVGLDRQGRDLAALKLKEDYALPHLLLATHADSTVGDTVYAIGTPTGIANTMTSGIVSNVMTGGSEILHNAAINSGNSGGPLLNQDGQVIGINTRNRTAAVFSDRGSYLGRSVGSVGMGIAISASEVSVFTTAVNLGLTAGAR